MTRPPQNHEILVLKPPLVRYRIQARKYPFEQTSVGALFGMSIIVVGLTLVSVSRRR